MTKRVYCDIEANGLTPDKVWCVVVKEEDTGAVKKFVRGENLNDFLSYSSTVDQWIGHNFLSYDMPVLNKLLGTSIKMSQVVDTMVLSLLFNVGRERIKGVKSNYSLEYWGAFFGHAKVEHEDWTQLSQAMVHRCVVDVEITEKAYKFLMVEGKDWSEESVILEHEVQYLLSLQKEKGFFFDSPKAHQLLNVCQKEADEIREEIHSYFKPKAKAFRQVTPKYKKDGTMSIVGLKKLEESPVLTENGWTPLDVVAGEFTLFDWIDFNIDSPSQVVERLELAGWEPVIFNQPTPNMRAEGRTQGSPKICEENLATLPATVDPAVQKVARYLVLNSRCKNIQTWFEALGEDNRIHGTVIGCGATTHRMSHMYPNTANIPANHALYGEECRQCWTVDGEDRRLVGVDAAGIQLRVLAHYMEDEDYNKAILEGNKDEGTDIHSLNQRAGGFATRDIAKTFIYAWLLGAGVAKIGAIIGKDAKAGAAVAKQFLKNIPSLGEVKEKAAVSHKRGYLKRLDGGRLQLTSEHKTLACYLQAGEAVIMKKAMVLAYRQIREEKLDAFFVGVIHDEFQLDCHKDHAERTGKIVAAAIAQAGRHFKLRIPMEGEAKIGRNWAETH